jgi:L-ascorbate metabolism protein UlaG (beta-lactamase superfamily)
VFFSGDTGLTTEYTAIRERLGPFDLVMLEVGAFHPSWGDIHLGPLNAVKAHALLGGGALLPVHWGTFALALHEWDEPVETLLAHAGAASSLLLPRLGQPVEPHHGPLLQPWWRGAHGGGGVDVSIGEAQTASDSRMLRELPWPLD